LFEIMNGNQVYLVCVIIP